MRDFENFTGAGSVRSEFLKNFRFWCGAVLVFEIFELLVQCGPRISKIFWCWCGAVLRFQKFFGAARCGAAHRTEPPGASTNRFWCVDPCCDILFNKRTFLFFVTVNPIKTRHPVHSFRNCMFLISRLLHEIHEFHTKFSSPEFLESES